MVAYAASQVRQMSDAEDLVQESFVGFLRTLDSYQQQSSLESWLFRILRRRIVDYYRARGTAKELASCAMSDDQKNPMGFELSGNDPSPSQYVMRNEQNELDEDTLSDALAQVVDHMKAEENLRDLMIMEGLFYAGIRNRSLSELIGVDEGLIAVVRHRLLKKLTTLVVDSMQGGETLPDAKLLTRIWERDRPSCPKRTTLGKSLVGILDDAWQDYIDFHVDVLGCTFCSANRDDLRQADEAENAMDRSGRIFQSTIGFVSRPR